MSECSGVDCQHPSCVERRDKQRAAEVTPKHLVGTTQFNSGPFKGRIYEKHADGTLGRRRLDLERWQGNGRA